MPGRDKRGPEGQGSMTGRQLGFCRENNYPARMLYRQFGGGFGRGRGMGFQGSSQNFTEPHPESYSSETEVETLYREAKDLKGILAHVEKRLSQLDKELKEVEKK